MTLLGKTEITQQSGDNSTNINAGRDVAISYQGLSYRDVKDIVDDMLRDRFNQFSRIAKKEAQKVVHAFLEKWLPELPPNKFYRFQEPKMQMFLHDVLLAYIESDSDEDVEKILFNALKTNLDDANAQKNAIIRRAVQALPLLSQTHINYLSFIYCLTDFPYEGKERQQIISEFQSVLNPLYSDEFLKNNFLSILTYTNCLQPFACAIRFISCEALFIRKYPHLFICNTTKQKLKNILGDDISHISDLFLPDKHHLHDIVLKDISYNHFIDELSRRGLSKYIKILPHCLDDIFEDKQPEMFLQEIAPELLHFASVWKDNNNVHSGLELTVVGRALAVFNCKIKIKRLKNINFTL